MTVNHCATHSHTHTIYGCVESNDRWQRKCGNIS